MVADIETIYSISDISFYNKGTAAKNKILTDPISMFSSSKTQGAQQCNLSKSKKGQIKIIEHYGLSFEMNEGTNLCFFNQALQLILHCQSTYDWFIQKTPSKIKTPTLICLYCIAKVYYKFRNNTPIRISSPYMVLQNLCLSKLKVQPGQCGDVAEVIQIILQEFANETPSSKKNYLPSCAFEMSIIANIIYFWFCASNEFTGLFSIVPF